MNFGGGGAASFSLGSGNVFKEFQQTLNAFN